MFIPKFRDLVRSSATVEGTAPVVAGAAPAGFTAFADALSVGDQFYYSLESLDHPDEHEVGRGRVLESGAISREVPGGALTMFSEGAKSIALVAAADYFEGADAGEVRGGVSSLPATPASLFAAAAPVELPRLPIVSADLAQGINFNLTLQTDTLLADPVNLKPGQSGRIRLSQDASGGHTMDFGPRWQFAGEPPVISSAAGAADLIAYFVNSDGAVEASLVKGLDVKPVPLAVSDFKNGIYRIGSAPVTLEEMWGDLPESQSFIAGSVVPGVGWQTISNTTLVNQLASTARLGAALAPMSEGLTFVLDYHLDQPSGTKPRIVVNFGEGPELNSGWGYYQNGNSYIEFYDYQSAYLRAYEVGPMGDSKVAVTLGPDFLALSRNGEAVITAPGDPMDVPLADAIWLAVYTSHDSASPSTATLRSVTIYRAQAAAVLESLSA